MGPFCGLEGNDCHPTSDADAEDDIGPPEFPDATIDDDAAFDAPEAGDADADLDGVDGASDAPSDADGA